MPSLQDLLRVVEAMQDLLLQERQEKLHLEMRLREEICNEMLEQLQQKEQWCRYCHAAREWRNYPC